MKTTVLRTSCTACVTLAILISTPYSMNAATRTKANNADPLNLASSWTNGVVPGSADVAQFDSTITGPLALSLGADAAWNQINFVNPGGDVTISAGHTLTLGNNNPVLFGSGAANLTLNCDLICAGSGFNTLRSAPAGQTVTYGGLVQGRDVTVTLGNTVGTLRLGSPNSVRIGTNVQVNTAGLRLGIGASSVGDPISSGPLGTNLFTWGASVTTTELFAYNGDQTLGNPLRIQFGPLAFNSSDDLTFTGEVNLNNGNRAVYVTNSGVLRFMGTITNATGLTKTGPGVLELGGTNVANWNNGLSIFGGTLRLRANDVIPDGAGKGRLRMTNATHVLDLNGFSDAINGVSEAGSGAWVGTIDNTAPDTTSVLTLGDQFTYTLHGNLQNTGSGSKLALRKVGDGGLILSNANTFSGGLTNASAGQIFLNAVGAAGTGPIVLAHTNAGLAYSGGGSLTWTNAIVVEAYTQPSLSAKDGSSLEIAGVISGPGRVWLPDNFSEKGPVIFSGDNTFTGGLLLAGGTVTLNHPRAAGVGPLSLGDPFYYTGSSLTLVAGVDLSGTNALTNAIVFNRLCTIGGTNPIEFTGPVTFAFSAPQVSINVTNPAGAVISGPIGGDGFGFNKTGQGLLTLKSVSTYTGRTSLSVGDMALGPSAALTGTPEIFVGQNTVFDVSAVSGFTIGTTQSLRGFGSVKGDVTVEGLLVPFGFFFAFTFSNDLTLTASSTTTVTISREAIPLDPQIVCDGILTFGGELVVENYGGAPQAGDTFHIFAFATAAGGFNGFTLPDLDPGLAWNTDNLAVDGTLSVVPLGPQPPRVSVPYVLSETNFVMVVSGGITNGQFRVLTHTNITEPTVNWEVISTNTFDGTGGLTFTNLINRAEPKRFFQIVQP